MSQPSTVFSLPWSNPLAWMSFVVYAALHPDWFGRRVVPSLRIPAVARRLLLQSFLAIQLFAFSAIGAGYLSGFWIPPLYEFYSFSWWLHAFYATCLLGISVVIVQTAHDYHKAISYTIAACIFVLVYGIALVWAMVFLFYNGLFLQREIFIPRILDLNILFVSGIGLYMSIVRLLEQKRMQQENHFLMSMAPKIPWYILLLAWFLFIGAIQYFNIFFQPNFDNLVLFLFGFFGLATPAALVSLLLGFNLMIRNHKP